MLQRLSKLIPSSAFAFVMMLGIVNLFSDMTYEGGGSINGQFLGSLGATAAAISIIAGIGEFLGYTVRSLSGYVGDKTGKPWLVTFVGYSVNLLAVPAMALVHNWWQAAALILAERIGRAIRKPTIESMLSYTTSTYGHGWVYALNTALDETGATLGPLLMTVILFNKGTYRFGYSILLVSSIFALIALVIAKSAFPDPSKFESKDPKYGEPGSHFSTSYWIFMLAGAFFAAGLMSYELVAYHLSKTQFIDGKWVPLFLAFATGTGVIANLTLGKFYDRFGRRTILAAVCLSSLFSPLLFFGGFAGIIAAMILLGVGYATQDSLLKSLVSELLPKGRRSLAFGLFYTGYGFGWLLGSTMTGMLYEQSKVSLVAFVVAAQILSLPIFIFADQRRNHA